VLTNHQLSEEAFTALACGDGDASVVAQLRGAQHSKHLMLVHVVAEAARDAYHASEAVAAFHAGYELLTAVQAADPDGVGWLLSLPHIGAWGHDCLTRLSQTLVPDFAYLAGAAATAAVRADVGFDLFLPVRDNRVLFPGLGYFHGIDEDSWVRATSDGKRLNIGTVAEVSCADIVPNDGSGRIAVPHWQGSPLIRTVVKGQAWEVLLETADPYLDRYTLPMAADLTGGDITVWRKHIQCAWRLLVEQHGWAAGPVAEGVSVIVPTISRSDTDLDSATTPAAFGAIATSLPPDPVIMAETLVHEFQHLKLGAVIDLVPLIEPCDERVYAPWRPDPRPASGLLQGIYAHLGVARFWAAQSHVEAEADDAFRAHLMCERWRPTIELSASTLLRTGCLTSEGSRFVEMLRDCGRRLNSGTVPAKAKEIAEEVALDHWLTWQLRHMTADAGQVAELAAAYQRGESLGDRSLPEVRIVDNVRKVESTVRSRLLNMRYLEPRRHIELRASDIPGIGEADALLFSGQADAAVKAYRDEISGTACPVPDVWIGLALAIRRLGPTPMRDTFAGRIPLIFDVHECLSARGIKSDPLKLAEWFA
jgi:HEXXH motif-containing protein